MSEYVTRAEFEEKLDIKRDTETLKADVKVLQTEIKRIDEKIDLTRSELSAKDDSLQSTLNIVVALVILILSILVAGFIKLIFFP